MRDELSAIHASATTFCALGAVMATTPPSAGYRPAEGSHVYASDSVAAASSGAPPPVRAGPHWMAE